MTLTLPFTAVNGQVADATAVMADFNVLLNGVNNALMRDGTSLVAADLPLAGYKLTGLGAPTLTTDAATKGYVDAAVTSSSVSLRQFGAVGDNATDNTAALAAAVAYAVSFTSTETTVRITVPTGIYRYATSPNWAVQGLHLDCSLGVIFKHTGSGIAFNIDGGATGAGIFGMRVSGSPQVQGNAATTDGVYIRAVHHSRFEMFARDVGSNAFHTAFTVANEYCFQSSSTGHPAFSPTPVTGFLLDQRGVGQQTADCTIYTPVFEGMSNYGLNLASASNCSFIGGTSEGNAGGVTIAASSTGNTFINLDMENNTAADILCNGSDNLFIGCYATNSAAFGGTRNTVIAGSYNTITCTGTDTGFEHVKYAIASGTFTDTGGRTVKRSVRNASSGALDPDVATNPVMLHYINGPAGNGFVQGASPLLFNNGGVNDLIDYKYGAGNREFWVNGSKNVTIGPATLGFFGAPAIAKPTGVANTTAGIYAALQSLGLIAP